MYACVIIGLQLQEFEKLRIELKGSEPYWANPLDVCSSEQYPLHYAHNHNILVGHLFQSLVYFVLHYNMCIHGYCVWCIHMYYYMMQIFTIHNIIVIVLTHHIQHTVDNCQCCTVNSVYWQKLQPCVGCVHMKTMETDNDLTAHNSIFLCGVQDLGLDHYASQPFIYRPKYFVARGKVI